MSKPIPTILLAALLAAPAVPVLAAPPVSQQIIAQGFNNYDSSDESQAYVRLATTPPGGFPRAELIYDMDNGSMRGMEEFNCARGTRRLLWAIQYRQSGLRAEAGRVGEQQDWVAVEPDTLDNGAMQVACGLGAGGK